MKTWNSKIGLQTAKREVAKIAKLAHGPVAKVYGLDESTPIASSREADGTFNILINPVLLDAAGFTPANLDALIAHEYGHLKNGDEEPEAPVHLGLETEDAADLYAAKLGFAKENIDSLQKFHNFLVREDAYADPTTHPTDDSRIQKMKAYLAKKAGA